MPPDSQDKSQLKRKRVEDRTTAQEDTNGTKRSRKEEKRNSQAAREASRQRSSHHDGSRAAPTPRSPRSKSPAQRRRSSQSHGLSKSERRNVQKQARLNGQAQTGATSDDKTTGSGGDQSILNGQSAPMVEASAGQGLSRVRQTKKERKHQRQSDAKQETGQDDAHARKLSRKEAKNAAKSRRSALHDQSNTLWSCSSPVGGRYVDCPAIFSPDESRLLFATCNQLGSHSTATSTQEHAINLETRGEITAYALSSLDPNFVWIGTRNGYVVSWNWKRGKQVGRWCTDTPVCSLACAQLEGVKDDTVLVVEQVNDNWYITAHRFGTDGDLRKTDATTLLKYDKSIRSVRVVERCQVIVALTPDSVLVGKLTSGKHHSLKQMAFDWREVPCREPPTCVDLRTSLNRQDDEEFRDIDLVFGGLKGALYYYQNLLDKLGMGNQAGKSVASRHRIKGFQMHWHREAVGAVAFSRDGAYIVSGGRETVLVLWQVDTGRKQFLPHLESPIFSITISPSGSSYAVGLGDNSIMVLSTAELKPFANFPGLQTHCTSNLPPHQLLLPTKAVFEQVTSGSQAPMVSATVNPTSPQTILCAVPSHQSIRAEAFPMANATPYMQTFIVAGSSSGQHIARQSMTRTNATNTNLGPEGNRLHEPSVTHLSVSHDGQWLASVDEWKPPKQDVDEFNIEFPELQDESNKRRTVSLRFWKWAANDEGAGEWVLNSRIEEPHTLDGSRLSGSVLALSSCPTSNAFSSVGEDGILRVWQPKTRLPEGRFVWSDNVPTSLSKKNQLKAMTWWAVRHNVPLDSPSCEDSFKVLLPYRAAMAYSNDGSLVAVHLQHGTASNAVVPTGASSDETIPDYDDAANTLVQFVDADYGKLQELRSDLCPPVPSALASGSRDSFDGIHAVGFLDHRLILVTRLAAYVWDVTSFTLLTTVHLPSQSVPRKQMTTQNGRTIRSNIASPPAPMLAINAPTQTFALATAIPADRAASTGAKYHVSPPHAHRDFTTALRVYAAPENPTSAPPQPLLSTDTPRLVLALLSAASGALERPDDAALRARDVKDQGRVLAARALARGYYAIDCAASVRSIRAPLVRMPSTTPVSAKPAAAEQDAPEEEPGEESGESDAESEAFVSAHEADARSRDEDEQSEGEQGARQPESRVVTSQQLSAVFEPNSSKMLPSLKEMFDGVLRLFAPGS